MPNNLNSGALFPNDNKTSENAPDYTGSVNVEGKDLRIAGWKQEKGELTYLSLKFSEPQPKAGQQAQEQTAPVAEKKKFF